MLPADHRLAERASVTRDDLAQQPFVAFTPSSSVRRLADLSFDQAGVRPTNVISRWRRPGGTGAVRVQPSRSARSMAWVTSDGSTGFALRRSQLPGCGWPVTTTSVVPPPSAWPTANVHGVQAGAWE